MKIRSRRRIAARIASSGVAAGVRSTMRSLGAMTSSPRAAYSSSVETSRACIRIVPTQSSIGGASACTRHLSQTAGRSAAGTSCRRPPSSAPPAVARYAIARSRSLRVIVPTASWTPPDDCTNSGPSSPPLKQMFCTRGSFHVVHERAEGVLDRFTPRILDRAIRNRLLTER